MLQQLPWAQLPQTVLPNLAPQLPSVVGIPLGLLGVVGFPITGSPEVVVEGGRVVSVLRAAATVSALGIAGSAAKVLSAAAVVPGGRVGRGGSSRGLGGIVATRLAAL